MKIPMQAEQPNTKGVEPLSSFKSCTQDRQL